MSMIFLSLKDASYLSQSSDWLHAIDGIEVRFEECHYDLRALRAWMQTRSCPVLFTWKMPFDRAQMQALLALEPEYCDVDESIDSELLQALQTEFPTIRWIVSTHNYEGTIDLTRVSGDHTADFYKIAITAHHTLDALELMEWARGKENVIAVAMGERGAVSRLIAPALNMPIVYAPLPGENTAPGQIAIDELTEKYQLQRVSGATKLYGLIGAPVTQSVSDRTHNRVFRDNAIDALYVKMHVEPDEFAPALRSMKRLGFCGLSVTTPHKEAALVYGQTRVGGANTIAFGDEDRTLNTDGLGACDALEVHGHVDGKHALVLGVGPTARAILDELLMRGAEVDVWNRTQSKLREIQAKWPVGAYNSEICYDIVVQATSVELYAPDEARPLFEKLVPDGVLALDVTVSEKPTQFEVVAHERGCTVVRGLDMFLAQAEHQFKFWNHATQRLHAPITL